MTDPFELLKMPIQSDVCGGYYLAWEHRVNPMSRQVVRRTRFCLSRPVPIPPPELSENADAIERALARLPLYDHEPVTRGYIDGTMPGPPRVTFEVPCDNALALAEQIGACWEQRLRETSGHVTHDPYWVAALNLERERLKALEHLVRAAEAAGVRLGSLEHHRARDEVTDADGRRCATLMWLIDLSELPPRIELQLKLRADLQATWQETAAPR